MRILVTIIDLIKGISLKTIKFSSLYLLYIGMMTLALGVPNPYMDNSNFNIMNEFLNNLNSGDILLILLMVYALLIIFSIIITFLRYKSDKYNEFTKRDVKYMIVTDIAEELMFFFLILIHFWIKPVIYFETLGLFIVSLIVLNYIASIIVNIKKIETKYYGKEKYISG